MRIPARCKLKEHISRQKNKKIQGTMCRVWISLPWLSALFLIERHLFVTMTILCHSAQCISGIVAFDSSKDDCKLDLVVDWLIAFVIVDLMCQILHFFQLCGIGRRGRAWTHYRLSHGFTDQTTMETFNKMVNLLKIQTPFSSRSEV